MFQRGPKPRRMLSIVLNVMNASSDTQAVRKAMSRPTNASATAATGRPRVRGRGGVP